MMGQAAHGEEEESGHDVPLVVAGTLKDSLSRVKCHWIKKPLPREREVVCNKSFALFSLLSLSRNWSAVADCPVVCVCDAHPVLLSRFGSPVQVQSF